MSQRIIDFLSLGKGAELLPFINISEIESIREFSNSVHIELDTTTYQVSFYGFTNPPEQNSVFDSIFKHDTEKMHLLLQTNQDRYVRNIYKKFPNESNVPTNRIQNSAKLTYYSLLWNGLNPLEVAYLMENKEMISILQSYQRTIAHVIKPFSTIYGEMFNTLAEKYRKNELNSFET